MLASPGPILLLGSGEASRFALEAYDRLLARLTSPAEIAILETPAGFEPNSAQVAGRIAAALQKHLRPDAAQVSVVPARQHGTPFSPDEPAIVAPLLQSSFILLGPGSPTYAVRQLRDSLCWHLLLARHRLGAAVVLASAGAIAMSAQTLPVYEIYKVGEALHWQPGLDLLGPYGLRLAILPHWDNQDGGAELDTSHCFMGTERYSRLRRMLPSDVVILGIDELTAVLVDIGSETCQTVGQGAVTVVNGAGERRYEAGRTFGLAELGRLNHPAPSSGLPPAVWQQALALAQKQNTSLTPDAAAEAVLEQRKRLRARQDWRGADQMRDQLAAMGWLVEDTPSGSRLRHLPGAAHQGDD